jgi:Kef-type K+ transport system membrane component KefB
MPAPLLSIVPTLPFTDPVLIVALATLIFLAVPILAERVRVPGVIGLILAGAAVGPHGFGLLARDQTIVLLGTVGLLYLMLMVGLELDLHQFNRFRNRSIVFGLLSFLIPAALGLGLGLALGYSAASALLLASAFSSHTLLAYPIARSWRCCSWPWSPTRRAAGRWTPGSGCGCRCRSACTWAW